MSMKYETDSDKANEDRVASALGTLWNCEVLKNKEWYEIDRTLTRDGEVVAFMEIKCRTKQYPSVFLSLNKWLAGRHLARETGKPFIAAYGLPDGIYYYLTRDEKFSFSIKVTGRKDRNDPNDIQPAIEIPLTMMTRLQQKEAA